MAFTQKSATLVQRDEGELPDIPSEDLKDWWDDTKAVIDRVRDKVEDVSASTTTTSEPSSTLTASEIKALYESNSNTNVFSDSEKNKLSILESSVSSGKMTKEEIKEVLGILGEAVGTLNEQQLESKTISGGSF